MGYGIGQNYERVKGRLDGRIRFHYLVDKKWEHTEILEYDGIPVIRLQELKQLKHVLVVLFPKFSAVRDVIKRELAEADAEICYIHELFTAEHSVRSDELIQRLPVTEYCDEFHNRIIFDETIPKNIRVCFLGQNNVIEIGNNLSVNRLDIYLGNNSLCKIGNRTSVVQAACWVSDAELKIGEGWDIKRFCLPEPI